MWEGREGGKGGGRGGGGGREGEGGRQRGREGGRGEPRSPLLTYFYTLLTSCASLVSLITYLQSLNRRAKMVFILNV